MTADDLWWQVWTKIRYAGFRASYVTAEIERLRAFFGDFRLLGTPDWTFDPYGNAHGSAVQKFLTKTGQFDGINYNKRAPKLWKILSAAEVFRRFPKEVTPLTALFGNGYDSADEHAFWQAHRRLAGLIGYTTALHVMMDLGFDCLKPDIWVVRLMCRLGWIEDVLAASSADTHIRKVYRTPEIAAAVITCAKRIMEALRTKGENVSLREIDFVIVKYGQKPGEFGMVRSLHEEWLPIQRIMEWQPDSALVAL